MGWRINERVSGYEIVAHATTCLMMRNEVVMKLKECVSMCVCLILNQRVYLFFEGKYSVREALKLEKGE